MRFLFALCNIICHVDVNFVTDVLTMIDEE